MIKSVRFATSSFGALFLALGVVACDAPFDSHRPQTARESLGLVLYENFCERIATGAYPDDRNGRATHAVCHAGATPAPGSAAKLRAFHAERARFIDAVDAVVAADPELAEDLSEYLLALLPLYDEGSMGQHASKLADLLKYWRMPEISQAFAGLSTALAPAASQEPPLMQALLAYPRLQEVLEATVRTFGPQGPGHTAVQELQRALNLKLSGRGTEGFAALTPVSAFLLSSLPEGGAQPQTRWQVAHDARMLPLVARLADGSLAAPFVEDSGQAATDAEGRFIDAQDRPLDLRPWGVPNAPGFDAEGRAVDGEGRLRFVYHDVGRSVLAGMLVQGQQVMARNPGLWAHTTPALRAVMGPDRVHTRRLPDGQLVQWHGFDASASPFAEVGHTLGWLAQRQGVLPAMTALAEAMWRDHEPALAAALDLGWKLVSWTQAPEVRDLALKPGNSLVEDFLDLGVEIARVDGLLEDLHAALQDPATRPLGQIIARHMMTRDLIDYPKTVDEDGGLQPNGPPTGSFEKPVIRASDSPLENRSIMERLLHLVHDSQQTVCSEANDGMQSPECYFFQIDNAALFYLQSVVGDARFVLRLQKDDPLIDSFRDPVTISTMTGISGFSDPYEDTENCPDNQLTGSKSRCFAFKVTPQAAARMFFIPHDPRLGEYGVAQLDNMVREPYVGTMPMNELHHSTLFAWELDGFFDAVRPLLKAFAKHHREDLVLRLLNVMHKHWATKANGLPELKGDMAPWNRVYTGLSQFEPFMARLLTEGRLPEVASGLLEAAQSVRVVHANGSQVLAAAARQLLVAPTFVADTQVKPVTDANGQPATSAMPLRVLHRAMMDVNRSLPADTDVAGLLEPLAHAFLPVTCTDGRCAFGNRQIHALTGASLRFAREQVFGQLDPAKADGGMKEVGEGFTQAVLQLVESPLTGNAMQMLTHIVQDAQSSAEFSQLLYEGLSHHLGTATQAMALVLGVTPQPFTAEGHYPIPPLNQALASLLGYPGSLDDSMIDAQVRLLDRVLQIDEKQVLSRTLKGLAVTTDEGACAASVLGDVFLSVNRAAPGASEPLLGADYSHGFLASIEGFLRDRRHGFARLLDVIAQRNGAPTQVAPEGVQR